MNQRLPPPYRPATFEEEWDNPAMAQFKREEAEDREAFGRSEEARAWLAGIQHGKPREMPLRLAPKFPEWQGFKIIHLPW